MPRFYGRAGVAGWRPKPAAHADTLAEIHAACRVVPQRNTWRQVLPSGTSGLVGALSPVAYFTHKKLTFVLASAVSIFPLRQTT
ncbi:hypothetical protein [Paenibacillus sp. NAIST15-1]|uniref:hypothetical protein n=1 Tax=Paenibacillus sp. NAIST15-1 TaxID=1605994 RepID=UPI001D114F0A|nr:hypothetical protein [Paenibacillus sp. NAIST15-1]